MTVRGVPSKTVQQQQAIIDRVMREMAIRHGSSTRRDFEVACLMIEMLGSGTDSQQRSASCEEVMCSHRDRESADFNDCDTAPCAWCDDVLAAIQTLSLFFSAPAPLPDRAGTEPRLNMLEQLLIDYHQWVEVDNESRGEWFWLDQIEDRIGRDRYLQIMRDAPMENPNE